MQHDVVDPARLDHLSSSLCRPRSGRFSPGRAGVADTMSQRALGLKHDPSLSEEPTNSRFTRNALLDLAELANNSVMIIR
jgi:hypothetical protein